MLVVLNLDPVLLTATTVWSIEMLGDQSLQSHPAGCREEIRTDLAAFERIDEDTLGRKPFAPHNGCVLAQSPDAGHSRHIEAPEWNAHIFQ